VFKKPEVQDLASNWQPWN